MFNKKEVLEMAKQAGYNNDTAELTRLLLEKAWVGETNIQRAFLAGAKQREKEAKNKKGLFNFFKK